MLLLVFRKVYICNIMSHTNIMQAEENDLVNILSLQKKSFMVVAERMNKFDLPPLLQNQDEICDEYHTGIILKYVSDDGQIVGNGTHEELLKSCSLYREIAEIQLGKEADLNEKCNHI